MLTAQTIVYRVSLALSEASLVGRRSLLSVDERAKADRFIVPQPRIQYIACRSALRMVLAELVDLPPDQIGFDYQRLGKPQIATRQLSGKEIHFNISHSGQWGLIALSAGPVGVDVERLQPRINAKSLMSQVISPRERLDWERLHSSQYAEQIIRLWVCKEALLKAMGLGIAECLQQVSFQMPIQAADSFGPVQIDPSVQIHLEESPDCRCNNWLLKNFWKVHPLEIDSEYFAAVVTSSTNSAIELRDFE